MSEWDNMRKHELECMRLASDCMQLAGDVDPPALRSHFIRMARGWTTLADRDPSADTQTKHWTKRVYPAHARISRQQAPALQYETRQAPADPRGPSRVTGLVASTRTW